MCLMAFAWQTGDYPLILLGNRDEFHARPTRAAGFWTAEGQPDLLAGKDLDAGGTWLGVTRAGRFAALTNIRAPGAHKGPQSRGALALDYLAGKETPKDYLQQLQSRRDDYAGFNLLVGDLQQLWYLNSQTNQLQQLPPGIYGLSNASLDSDWPKLQRLRAKLADNLNAGADVLLDLLSDTQTYPDQQLPQTGVSLEWERRLSATFILGEDYGTRASSLLKMDKQGGIVFVERRFAAMGVALGESCWHLAGD
ncbi:NRDE family protein [Halopseudomonas pelagia]|uniref:NRDE family protein n=1 Tax=Halopseudomonas pelagia TaxID=553151 RepID=UPI00039B72B4|nr:NRDE family protein [Halopseudomonas pelagia]